MRGYFISGIIFNYSCKKGVDGVGKMCMCSGVVDWLSVLLWLGIEWWLFFCGVLRGIFWWFCAGLVLILVTFWIFVEFHL